MLAAPMCIDAMEPTTAGPRLNRRPATGLAHAVDHRGPEDAIDALALRAARVREQPPARTEEPPRQAPTS